MTVAPPPGTPAPVAAPRRARAAVRPHPVWELLFIAALYSVYRIGRVLASGHVGEAMRNAHRVWDLERTVHLPGEERVQALFLHSESVIRVVNCYYAYVHFPAIVVFMLWMYLRRPAYYRWVRWVLIGLTGLALVLHLSMPLAPPRMLGIEGLIDTGQRFGPAVYGAPQAHSIANQYAAMPSLHIGWAIVIAMGLIVSARTRWRWLWVLHPVATVLVVVGTANHYWMDGIVVSALLAIVLVALRPSFRRAREADAPAIGEYG
ncbi:phosphatase PAP2 family protein [Actinomadura rayongensis]|uniref:Inositol phosphorylceramide synthase n=1 Tax=Actinomadura rayongensis TaxID=1429076 RepID=A0A6I4WKK7_9ACTN|nr:phosphatase PAP2 family protein [Actinomadura rayongensis]MXQ67122.1 inositol phosphorylceramide synthase [Actinomadura rayongensis]